MDYYKKFHEQISNAVELSEFTQKQIASKVNITESSLSKYLNNKQSLDMNTIFALVEVLGLNVGEIINSRNDKLVKVEMLAYIDSQADVERIKSDMEALRFSILDIKISE